MLGEINSGGHSSSSSSKGQQQFTQLAQIPPSQDTNSLASKPSLDKTIFNNERRHKTEGKHKDDGVESKLSASRHLSALKDFPRDCAHEDLFAHMMYASVCAFVLSDDPSHHAIDYFPLFTSNRYPHNTDYKGELSVFSLSLNIEVFLEIYVFSLISRS